MDNQESVSKFIEENEYDKYRKCGFAINAEGVLYKYDGKAADAEIPFGVLKIAEGAFRGCTTVQSVLVPDSVTEIENEAFNGCSSLETLKIGSGVQHLGSRILADCTAFKKIVFHGSRGAFNVIPKEKDWKEGAPKFKLAPLGSTTGFFAGTNYTEEQAAFTEDKAVAPISRAQMQGSASRRVGAYSLYVTARF